jgi:hypothetical protein
LVYYLSWQHWGLNSGLGLPRQALYHWTHSHNPFWFSYFSASISNFWLGPASDCNPPKIATQVAGITDMSHQVQPAYFSLINKNERKQQD